METRYRLRLSGSDRQETIRWYKEFQRRNTTRRVPPCECKRIVNEDVYSVLQAKRIGIFFYAHGGHGAMCREEQGFFR